MKSNTDTRKSKVMSNTDTQMSKVKSNTDSQMSNTDSQMSKSGPNLHIDTGGAMYKRNLASYVESESISTCEVPYSTKYTAWEVVRAVGHDPSRIGYRPSMSLLLEWGKRCEMVVTEDTIAVQLRDCRGATTFVATLDRKTMGQAHIQAVADIISRHRNLKTDPYFIAESDSED